jgi:hypothetical protein
VATTYGRARPEALATLGNVGAVERGQRDLSVSHDKVGDLAVQEGDLAAARTAYQASHEIFVRLAAADPTNTQWQHDLVVSHNKLGDLGQCEG